MRYFLVIVAVALVFTPALGKPGLNLGGLIGNPEQISEAATDTTTELSAKQGIMKRSSTFITDIMSSLKNTILAFLDLYLTGMKIIAESTWKIIKISINSISQSLTEISKLIQEVIESTIDNLIDALRQAEQIATDTTETGVGATQQAAVQVTQTPAQIAPGEPDPTA